MGLKNYLEISIAARIKQLRLSRGLSQKEFAASIGIVQGYLSSIERGKKMPSPTIVIALCHVHQVTEEWLFSGADESNDGVGAVVERQPVGIPLLNNPQALSTEIKPADIAGYVSLPDSESGSYALFAEGDFMAPTIRDGDLVVFQSGGEPRNREIVLLNNKWGEMILRRCRVTACDTYFAPDNSSYAPFKLDDKSRIYGRVSAVWRRVKI